MSAVMNVGRLMVGRIFTVQRVEHPSPQPAQHHSEQARAQLPIEHVAEGDVLDRHSTLDSEAASFHTTNRYLVASVPGAGSATAAAQRAIAEYQSFALLEKGRSVPLYNIDEYV